MSMEPDGPDGIRFCTRCKVAVPVSEWRLEHTSEGVAVIVHVGDARNIISFDPDDIDHVCGNRERVPDKIKGDNHANQ